MNTELISSEQPWPSEERGHYRIMVVEDEELMRSIIVQLLRSEGYEVIEAAAADVALQTFERENVDVAILDINLGAGGSGLDLLGKLRDRDSEVMCIMVTAC